MNRNFRLLGSLFVIVLAPTACNRDPAPGAPEAHALPVPAPAPEPVVAASAAAAPTYPAKVDSVDPAGLKAGLDAMVPRVLTKVDAYRKVEPNDHFRFFMHPDETKNASIEFNTKGLSSLSIAPYIEDFSGNASCMGNPEAGLVRLTWSLDGGEKTHLMVDRTYNSVMTLDVAKSSRLKLEVDKGNDVIHCDWFSVGFVNVK
jgi:hypothetical protein